MARISLFSIAAPNVLLHPEGLDGSPSEPDWLGEGLTMLAMKARNWVLAHARNVIHGGD